MGLYYRLSNGEDIEIMTEWNEDGYVALVKLFNGSTVLTYNLSQYKMLNDIIAEIEENYTELEREDLDFAYRCNCD